MGPLVSAPIDMAALRRAIEEAPAEGRGACVSRDWLMEVEQELLAGRAAMRELGVARVCDQIRG